MPPDPYVTARSHGLRASGYHDGAVQPARRPWGEISRAGGAKDRGKRAPAIGTPTTARPSVRHTRGDTERAQRRSCATTCPFFPPRSPWFRPEPTLGLPPDPFWARRRSTSTHEPSPRRRTASGRGAVPGRSPRRAAHGLAGVRGEDTLMNHREFLFRSVRPRPSNGPYGERLNCVCTRRGPRAAQWTRPLRGRPALPFILRYRFR